VAVANTASDLARGVKQTASNLGRELRKGSSLAGRYLRLAGELSQKVDKLAKAGGPLLVAAVVIDVARGKDPLKTAARAMGAVLGGALGATACSVHRGYGRR
jgi:hypothetical protein